MSSRELNGALEASVAQAAKRLQESIDAEVLEKLLEDTVGTTTGPNGTLDAQRIKRVLRDMSDEKVTVDIYISSKSFDSAVRVFFEDYSYGHELGITSGASVDDLIVAFDGALEGLQHHIESKEMEAWL